MERTNAGEERNDASATPIAEGGERMLALPPPTAEQKELMERYRCEGLAIQARVRAAMGPEPLDILLSSVRTLPESCRNWPSPRLFQWIRFRLGFTQQELARRAGLAPSQISRLEAGRDCLFSTWTRAYAAMGLDVRLIPASLETAEQLEAKSPAGRPEGRPSLRPHGPWFRRRGDDVP